ncbi:MAG: type II toxin-antitoxin system VapC family toxin [Acidobacteria bacterium]|nr:type II toxin-antitoxin system VapC family toxin [Acidobacteriota bacterium]MYA45803.1 type II toxin-antitoxin system VapC family toxin [Acidobacteriota bacterium]MYB31099.1 type II toxin-antitoxin system VapC family toxin [Acidobacteriota bacterium]MYH23294.1 type II toxin-antitoxin system VapC family toxin [Acidobacteriota bacterium]MYI40167.1 type II toxin-antitoxin system VapC family toxin [Acidobacteriota bacterium]
MTSRYLLDSDVVSEPTRPAPSAKVLDWLARHEGESAIAAPVWHELRFGCERLPPSRRRDSIESYLAEVVLPSLPIFDYDQRAAEWHARERARLAKVGQTPPFVDGQIAAIARVNDLTLVTRNQRDFRWFEGLRMERWG